MGILLGTLSLALAFRELDVFKIYGQVLSFNQRSIRFHQNLGFFQEGILRKHFNDERGQFDIFQFGLLQSEWLERLI
jgi:RimJ/RimL family protein N-acetyltransferase